MNHIDKTIEELKQKVQDKQKELIEAQTMVNSLCKMAGKPPIYIIEEESKIATGELQGDEYYGRPLATVITTILEGRKIQGFGPATIKEIYEQMTAGGYQFDAKNDNNAMRGIRISMSKNVKFHKLPNGKWGLKEWYPNIKDGKGTSTPATKDEASTENDTNESN